MYNVGYSDEAVAGLAKLRKSKPAAYKKAVKLIEAILKDPRHGIGKPEPLKGGDNITWSRRITGQDRVVYDIYDSEVFVYIFEAGGHYGNK